ncbi:MAG: flagellar hook-basal body complex protein [Planctomycetes bacterium]|nr:flagellar hook-basal body complex protein [Planctomycetota bacterium]
MVNTALFTGLAGLRSHQTHIDVIGANLANVSTPGYRGARMTFSDILSFTVRPGSGPDGNFGGTNPLQIGLGSSVGSVDVNTNQGTFQDTGRPLDVAIQGRGFFTLTDGSQTYYTRVGTFGVDANRNLVDSRSGFRVIASDGTNISVPEADTLPAQPTTSISFGGSLPAQVSGPLLETVSSEAPLLSGTAATKTTGTGPIDLSGFLGKSVLVAVNGAAQQRVTFDASDFANPAAATAAEIAAVFSADTTGLAISTPGGAVQLDTIALGENATLKFDDATDSTGLLAQLGLNTTLVSGTQAVATGTTDLANLTTRISPYANGDTIAIGGTNVDGTPFSATFTYGAGNDGTTVNDMLTFINGLIATDGGSPAQTATASLSASGTIELTSRDKGPASLSLSIGDLTSSTKNGWPNFILSQNGTGPDTATASIDVVDSQGLAHPVTFTFTRSASDSNIWDLQATIADNPSFVTSGTISSIRFNADGSFNVIGGGSNQISFAFPGAGAQSVTIDLGSQGQFNGVTMLGNATTVAAVDQDGFGAGTLLNVAIDQQGRLTGFYTNGQNQVLDTLRISLFANEGGLLRSGETMFVQSPNSDDAISTVSGAAGAGSIRAGSLENSNVDIAEEFVALIEAQRGFQANSRIITTSDEILAELVNIVR